MPYIGEIRMFGGNFAPAGWMFCNGQELPISENEALFQLIGTQYGGDGQSTFGLPNLGGRIPVGSDYGGGWGSTWVFGQMAGSEEVTLTTQQMPVHNHMALGNINPGNSNSPANDVPASYPAGQGRNPYGTDEPYTTLSPTSVGPIGGSQPHTNMQPYQTISFIISLFGIFPPPN